VDGPRLTIGLPTYNRAARLAEQLDWLGRAVRGHENRCEVVLSDNASSDETPRVIDAWRSRNPDIDMRVLRNETNIGAVRNVAQCLRAARGRHVWVVGDDDAIAVETLEHVVRTVTDDPDLALLILNYSMRDEISGEMVFERCFELAGPRREFDGAVLFERCLGVGRTVRWGGLGFTTALVYRTDLAQLALARWPSGLDNLAFQVYISGFCASQGPAALTPETRLECAAGRHHFSGDTRVLLGFWSAHMAEMFVRLIAIGYSRRLCTRRILERPKSFTPLVLASVRRWPVQTAKMLGRYVVAVARALWTFVPPAR
jgi:hypothetical protein